MDESAALFLIVRDDHGDMCGGRRQAKEMMGLLAVLVGGCVPDQPTRARVSVSHDARRLT